jgi:carbamoyltransferase
MLCGLKLTHDGGFALVDAGKLLLCTESEKVDNGARYADLSDLGRIRTLLADLGLDFDELDVAVDGWVQFHGGATEVAVRADGVRQWIPVAGYDERRDARLGGAPLTAVSGRFPGAGPAYRSFAHATGHLFSAYCTSPAAAAGEPSLVLVWDGGMPACLYRIDPRSRTVRAYGVALDISGAIYPTFASLLDPFRLPPDSDAEDYLPISGKAMAYAGLGAVSDAGLRHCAAQLARHGGSLGRRTGAEWSAAVIADMTADGCTPADMIATMQHFLGRALVAALRPYAAQAGPLPLAFAGGCALNIKWNAALRASGLFSDVWVPPFPNDSGSAIGAACAALAADGGPLAIEWDVFAGPQLRDPTAVPDGWTAAPATIEDIARLLHVTGEPVVVLSGAAELGPRALGHRSIIAPAVDAAMRDRLNDMKGRERYRPVAPICLEDLAPRVFEPGGPDRYMLFDHRVRDDWRARVPAIMHVDGSARLQTVHGSGNPLMARLLEAYHALSGVPVLCNTSANHQGRGFFPDVASAMAWGAARYVWSDGIVYRRGDA